MVTFFFCKKGFHFILAAERSLANYFFHIFCQSVVRVLSQFSVLVLLVLLERPQLLEEGGRHYRVQVPQEGAEEEPVPVPRAGHQGAL